MQAQLPEPLTVKLCTDTATLRIHLENPIVCEILGDLNCASKTLSQAARYLVHAMRNRSRPSVVLRPQLQRCHDDYGRWSWLASYGDLYAFGETPEEAYQEFDAIWCRG